RPLSASLLIDSLPDDADGDASAILDASKTRSILELDPGWILERKRANDPEAILQLVADRDWWRSTALSAQVAELLGRLWRHSIAVKTAAYWLARDAGDPDPDAVAVAGQLCGLGYWAMAVVDPVWLTMWWGQEKLRRRQTERDDLGC